MSDPARAAHDAIVQAVNELAAGEIDSRRFFEILDEQIVLSPGARNAIACNALAERLQAVRRAHDAIVQAVNELGPGLAKALQLAAGSR